MEKILGKLSNGDPVSVHNSAGTVSYDGRAEMANNALIDVRLESAVVLVNNGDAVVVKNSAGTTVAGTHTAEAAAGVLTDVKLAATVAPVTNGQALTGVTPSGSYTNTVTFTVAAGVITAIVLS